MNTYIIYLLLYLVIFISVINFLNDVHNNIIKEKIKKEEDQKKIRNLEIEGFSGYVDACVLLSFFRKEDAVVLLIKWVEDNIKNINEFLEIKLIFGEFLEGLGVTLNFNLEDVFTIASLFSLQLNIKQVANKHQDIIRRKYKQLVYKDDYGNTISKDFDNEILYFIKNVINNDENIIKSISLYVRPCVFRNLYISTKKTAPNVDEEIIKANINKRTDIIIETITNFMVSDIINNLKFDEIEKNNVDQESLDHYEYEKFWFYVNPSG